MPFRSTVAVFSLFVSAWMIHPSTLDAHTEPPVPSQLNPAEWSQIQQQMQTNRLAARPHDEFSGALQAVNPAQGFTIDYLPDGQTVLNIDGDETESPHAIAVRLQGYGYGDELIEVDATPTLTANAHTVTYQWKPTLREWWINSPRGVEQWFELSERPAVAKQNQPLVVAMRLDTDLNAQIQSNVLNLESDDGSTHLTYDRLKVWDDTGRVLPSEMILDGQQLALQVDDADAVYPVTIDPTFAQQAYIKASNTDAADEFGFSIDIDGDTAVVGAILDASVDANNPDDNSGFGTGAAYVFVRDSSGQWSQQAYLKASNLSPFDLYGWSVGISGDTIVVGAIWESSGSTGVNGDELNTDATFSGAAYVYTRTGTSWAQQAYLKPSNTGAFSEFGWSVAIDGDTIAVGARLEDSELDGVFNGDDANGQGNDLDAFDAGSAYVFVRDGSGQWSQQAYFKASNSGANDEFGVALALDQDTLVVSANREDSNSTSIINGSDDGTGGSADNNAGDAGAAYVFVRDGVTWSQQAYIKSSNAEADDQFGLGVDIDGDTLVVGALSEDSDATGVSSVAPTLASSNNDSIDSGAVYVFERNGLGEWAQEAYIKASNTGTVDQFGTGLSLDGNLLAVGANSDDSGFAGPNLDSAAQADNSVVEAGAAYVFERNTSGEWSQQSYIKASNPGDLDEFGRRLVLSGTTLMVASFREDSNATGVNPGATAEADNSAVASGAAYIFDLAEYEIGGTVNGLVGSGLELQNNGGDNLLIAADGAFTFMTAIPDGSNYVVTVLNQPTNPSQTCTLLKGTGEGEVDGRDVTNVIVQCDTDSFTVGGTISGLAPGNSVVLQNNGGDDLNITDNGNFVFDTALLDLSDYSVSVLTQPTSPSQTCTVEQDTATGTLAGANVTNIVVTCVTDQFTVGGTVTGLAVGNSVVLQNNGSDDRMVNDNVAFAFAPQDDGTGYNVTVLTQPTTPNQTCTVEEDTATGTLVGANVTNILVTCVTDQFTVGGMVSGLTGAGLVLQNNGGDDLPVAADGGFTFPPQDDGTDYDVTVLTQPSTARDQQCTVSNGTGTLAGANVSDVQVQCVDITLGLSTDDLDLGLVFLGENVSGTIDVTNTGSADVTINSFSSPGAPFSLIGGSCQALPITLAAGESCTLDISFSPTEAGEFNDQILVSSNAVSSPDTINLRGRSLFEPLAVPTLNAFGLLALMLIMLGMGWVVLRPKATAI